MGTAPEGSNQTVQKLTMYEKKNKLKKYTFTVKKVYLILITLFYIISNTAFFFFFFNIFYNKIVSEHISRHCITFTCRVVMISFYIRGANGMVLKPGT